jgi:hypothetical protein
MIKSFEKKLIFATRKLKVNGHTLLWSHKGKYQARWGKPAKGKQK